jgi:hypothetical protein
MFVACVALCGEHAEEAKHDGHALLYVGVGHSPDSESCPIVEAPKATLISRLAIQAAATIGISPAPSNASSVGLSIALRDSHQSSSTDPPFERLRTLRI